MCIKILKHMSYILGYVRRESVDSAGVISVGVLSAMVLLLGVILIIAMFYHQIKLFIYSRLPFGYLQDIGMYC